jgi:hypothetical protein
MTNAEKIRRAAEVYCQKIILPNLEAWEAGNRCSRVATDAIETPDGLRMGKVAATPAFSG